MFFEKIEKIFEEYEAEYNHIFEKLDKWLAFLPLSYRSIITVERFMVDSEIQSLSINMIYDIFKKLESEGLLEKRYRIYCPEKTCRHEMAVLETIKKVSRFIINHNYSLKVCKCCEARNRLTSNDVYFIYKLLDNPKKIKFN